MVDRIGQGSGLAKAAVEAALKRQAEAAARIKSTAQNALGNVAPQGPGADPTAGSQVAASDKVSGFSTALADGLASLNSQVQDVDQLPVDVLRGEVTDFHEVAARLKESEISMRFSLEVRNKFIDAYREIMRMSV